MFEFLERLIPLLVALLTAITPVIVAIISSGKKSRKQQQEESEKLHVSMAGMKESLDGEDGRPFPRGLQKYFANADHGRGNAARSPSGSRGEVCL